MAVAASLNVNLTANSAQFETTMRRSAKTAKTTGATITATLSRASSGIGKAMGLIGVGFGANALRAGTMELLNSVEAADNLSKRLGMSYNALKAMELAAEEGGSSAEVMTTALEKMTNVIGQAAFGEKASAKALGRLNLSYERLRTLKPEQQFVAIMQGIRQLETPMERAAALQDIFGRGAGELGTLVDLTASDLARYGKELESTGQALSGSQLQKLLEAEDAVDRLSRSWNGFAMQMTATIAPAITSALDAITASMQQQDFAVDSWQNTVAKFIDQYGYLFDFSGSGVGPGQPLDYGPNNSNKPAFVPDPRYQGWADRAAAAQKATEWRPPSAISAGTNEDAIFSFRRKLDADARASANDPRKQGLALLKKIDGTLMQIARALDQQPVEYTV